MASEDDEDATYVVYGQPLEEEEEDKKANPAAVENQVVKDEQGRRRFHGAFTGGFSAGYYNSVGSKEGWTPSTFVSSRKSRGERKTQTAEDFMDDEDTGEYGIAPRQIKTAEMFSQPTIKRSVASDRPSAIPGSAPLEDLIIVTNGSVGTQILKKMGWREGQGIGPKVKKYKHKDQKEKAGSEHEGDTQMGDFLFGPDDAQEFLFQMKDDQHGLGYSGISRDTAVLGGGHISLFGPSQQSRVQGKRSGVKGSGFGIGAFEEADGDIYALDDMNMYDNILGGEDVKSKHNFGWTAPKAHHVKETDIDGFLPGSRSRQLVNKVYPPPTLSRNYRPVHLFSDDAAAKEERGYSRFTLSSNQRSAMLGEDVLPGKPVADPPAAVVVPAKDSTDLPATSSNAFQPFKSDPEKQKRYEMYKTGGKDSSSKSGGVTEWETQREKTEFGRAASLYKPLSALMSSRFVTAKHIDDGEDVASVAVEYEVDKDQYENAAEMKMYGKLTRDTFDWHPDPILCKRFNVPDPYPGSATVGIPSVKRDKFSVFTFLSNISHNGNTSVPVTSSSSANIQSKPETLPNDRNSPLSTIGKTQNRKYSRWDIKPLILDIIEERRSTIPSKVADTHGGDENSDEEIEKRPAMDLFQAIFDATDSNDSQSDSDTVTENQIKGPSNIIQEPDRTTVTKIPSNSGIETKLNTLDHHSNNTGDKERSFTESNSQNVTGDKRLSTDEEVYGPPLPPTSSPSHLPREDNLRENASSSHRTSHRKNKRHRHHTTDHRKHSRKSQSSHKEKRRKVRKHKNQSPKDRKRDKRKAVTCDRDSTSSSHS